MKIASLIVIIKNETSDQVLSRMNEITLQMNQQIELLCFNQINH